MNAPRQISPQAALLSAFGALNPATGFGGGGQGAATKVCSVDRMVLAGGQLASYMTSASLVPLERVWRRLPEEGIFEATPNSPCQFEMGNLVIPPTMGFVLLDYHFDIYRPSGSAVDEAVPLEENRLSTQIGWDIQSSSLRQGNTNYELTPLPPKNNSPAYQSNPNAGLIPGGPASPATEDQFTAARYQQSQSAIGDGLSVMPQRHHRQGLLHVSCPWILHSSQSLSFSVRVFRGPSTPIAFFEASCFGFLIPDQDLIAMELAIAPCPMPPGGI